ncbi:hypothetical protein M9458_052023, partial [Cirrhinus mrigala]
INQQLSSVLRREGPHSSLTAFLDYALLTVGSLFTAGVVEEERRHRNHAGNGGCDI